MNSLQFIHERVLNNEAIEKKRLEAEEEERQRIAEEKTKSELNEKAAHEKAEQEAAEKARLEAEEKERQRVAKEKAEREAAEKVAREKAEKEVAEKARIKAEEEERARFAEEKANREVAERERQEKELREKQIRETKAKEKKPVLIKPIVGRQSVYWFGGLVVLIIGIVLSSSLNTLLQPIVSTTEDAQPQIVFTSTYTEIVQPSATLTQKPTITPTKTLTPTPLPTEISDVKGVSMALVPEGEFTMGNDADSSSAECKKYSSDCQYVLGENPPHQVFLDAFYMDKNEVTNALYEACVTAGACDPPRFTAAYTRSNYYGNSSFDDFPVIHVDWFQSQTYCKWRGARLPTEAEWEKAARGTDERVFPWGDDIDCSYANYNYCVGDTTRVGRYEEGKSPYGIYDLAGNVAEWVADWYSETYYQSSPFSNPLGPLTGQSKVRRGGSWYFTADSLRVSSRYGNEPIWAVDAFGFRCAKDAP